MLLLKLPSFPIQTKLTLSLVHTGICQGTLSHEQLNCAIPCLVLLWHSQHWLHSCSLDHNFQQILRQPHMACVTSIWSNLQSVYVLIINQTQRHVVLSRPYFLQSHKHHIIFLLGRHIHVVPQVTWPSRDHNAIVSSSHTPFENARHIEFALYILYSCNLALHKS